MGMKYFGARVPRREDPALLTGHGQFVADFIPAGSLHAAFVRAPFAHAVIRSIDTRAACDLPGVHAVFTNSDLPDRIAGARLPQQVPNAAITRPYTWAPLAGAEVCYAGEAVAIVVADNAYIAEDAAEMVAVKYDELPNVPSIGAALSGIETAHRDAKDNVAASFTVGYGDTDEAFTNAHRVVAETFRPHRGAAHPMECRGVVVEPDVATGSITIRSATQVPHLVKRSVMDVLGLDADQVRVIAPADVGGGFGPKAMVYPEEIVLPAVALMLGRPVKWIEDRREHFLSTTQERGQVWDVELAVTADGRIRGLRGRMNHDSGAYLPWGIVTPYISATTVPGPYVVPNYQLNVTCLLTNTVPTTPLRGAGRPQGVFVMERLMDHAADDLGLDRAEIRRRNLIQPEQMPYEVGLTYRDGSSVTYDSGDYPATLDAGLTRAGYEDFRRRQEEAWSQGRLLGIGMAFYVEGTGLGPFEGARVKIHRNGKATVYTSAGPQGQGHHTTLAQIAADQLGLDIADVNVSTGDTSTVSIGIGTFASRIAVNGGSSVHVASGEVRTKLIRMAASLLEAAEDDIELAEGQASVKGSPGTAKSFAELAQVSQGIPGFALTAGQPPGLEAEAFFTPSQSTYAHGFHVAEVEVHPETGSVEILHYVVAHDCGTVINPMIVEGQVQGGVAHGVGNALLEFMAYDDNSQPITMSFADYLLPAVGDVPVVDLVHLESPTPLNPLGVKGVGEGGTIPVAACVVSAVEDALRRYGAKITHHPITPPYIHGLIKAAGR